MNDDELKTLWQRQPLGDIAPSAAQLLAAMGKKTTRLRRILDARDLRELWACAFIVIIFGIFYFTVYRSPVSRLGDLIVIGSSIFIAWRLVYARRSNPPAPPGATVVESLRADLNAVRAQSRLLGSILWWYLLPLGIGVLVCIWGSPGGGLIFKTGYTLFVIVLYALIHRLNQRARSGQLLPIEAQLESLIRSAETGEPPEEADVADLRPVVLTMAAAAEVKPVEFKVAFWQVAIFGVPGIVGIWFFWMLSLGLDNAGLETRPPAFPPGLRAGETNHYAVVARRIVGLLNTGNSAGVEQLFNAEMSAVLPPRKASGFFADLTARFGYIESLDGPTGDGYRGWIAFRLHGQRGDLTMSLELDADDKIAGIYFLPARGSSGNAGSLGQRVLTPQRLLWFVPFLLGGLLYSWLMQKTTNRAVGISALGVHLLKGQNLVLWDEIKEVRPLKFLHIRNLWLIRESGEKTLMHWTPLERHAELKSAVERFAPAGHPIRKFLPLLKQDKSR
ncbi:MAG TPA: hypothetical protein VHH73_06845 [Verrucomicrobiae bacterium]|nr:hypothetical protein [Verrucomicrobiae bacterium]